MVYSIKGHSQVYSKNNIKSCVNIEKHFKKNLGPLAGYQVRYNNVMS